MKVTQQPIKTEKMSQGDKNTIKAKPTILLKTLYNNEACVTASTSFKWWIPVLFFIASLGISIIPATVTSANTKGSSIISSDVYSADVGLETFARKLNGESYDEGTQTRVIDETHLVNFEITTDDSGDHILTVDDTSLTNFNTYVCNTTSTYKETDENGEVTVDKSYSYYEYKVKTGSYDAETGVAEEAVRLRVFYMPTTESSEANEALKFFLYDEVFGTTPTTTLDSTSEYYEAPASLLVIGTTNFYYAKYKLDGSLSTYNGYDYAKTDVGYNLRSLAYASGDTERANGFAALASSQWIDLFNQGYKTTASHSALMMFLITFGMNFVIVILFGFTLWLMCRGKNNPNRHYKFYQNLFMAFYASLTPALLTLIVGFIWSSIAAFAFIALMAIRLMWLSMRNLRAQA